MGIICKKFTENIISPLKYGAPLLGLSKSVYYIMRTGKFYHTPGNISVSSKHVISLFDDGNRVSFPITPAVKRFTNQAVSGGAVTQNPLRVESNSRRQKGD